MTLLPYFFGGIQGQKRVVVTNVLGEEVTSFMSNGAVNEEVDLSAVKAGIYFVYVTHRNRFQSIKSLKK